MNTDFIQKASIPRRWWTSVPENHLTKKVAIHIQNGILLSHKKEHIWLSSNKIDEPKTNYTEWSKPEREKRVLCTGYRKMAPMSLSAGQQWRCRQRENRLAHTAGEGEGGRNWERSMETHTFPYEKLDSQYKFAVWCRKFCMCTFKGQSLENGLFCVLQALGNILLQRHKASMTRHRQQSTSAKSLSHVRLCETPQPVAHQVPLNMGFSRQEY